MGLFGEGPRDPNEGKHIGNRKQCAGMCTWKKISLDFENGQLRELTQNHQHCRRAPGLLGRQLRALFSLSCVSDMDSLSPDHVY